MTDRGYPSPTSSPNVLRNEPIAALDALRGLAALAVVLYHIGLLHGFESDRSFLGLRFVRNSYLMVDFFFVLSGFVIALNYGERIRDFPSAARFAWLRFWRLYPLHIFFLGVFLAIEFAKWAAQLRFGLVTDNAPFSLNDRGAFFIDLFLLQAFGLNHSLTFNTPAWSIGAEFYTYLVFALLVWSRRSLLLIAIVTAVLAAAVLAITSAKGLSVNADGGFIRCLFGFFLGVAVCEIFRRTQRTARIAGPLAACALLAIVALLSLKPAPTFDFAVPPLAAVLVWAIAAAPKARLARWLTSKPLAWLGAVSYSVYMSHWAILIVTINALEHCGLAPQGMGTASDLFLVACCVLPVLAVSQVTFTYIEVPLRAWSRRVPIETLAAPRHAKAWRSRLTL